MTSTALLPASQELATPAARAVGATRGPSGEGDERLRVPELGPIFSVGAKVTYR